MNSEDRPNHVRGTEEYALTSCSNILKKIGKYLLYAIINELTKFHLRLAFKRLAD